MHNGQRKIFSKHVQIASGVCLNFKVTKSAGDYDMFAAFIWLRSTEVLDLVCGLDADVDEVVTAASSCVENLLNCGLTGHLGQ